MTDGASDSADRDVSMIDAYDQYPRVEEAFQEFLDESLDPRGPDSLFEAVDELGLRPGARGVVDVGCGEGADALELARRFGFRVLGIDPVPRHVELATAAAEAAGLAGTVQISAGAAERLPVDADSVDLIWCKEVLMYADLRSAFSEFARVLGIGGFGLVYQVLTGPRMTDAEAAEFWGGDGLSAASVRPSDIHAAISAAGLTLQERIDYGSEWGERMQEQFGAGGRRLAHAARLLRRPDRYIQKFGRTAYDIMLSDCLWHVYRMIGKLQGATFIFTRTS